MSITSNNAEPADNKSPSEDSGGEQPPRPTGTWQQLTTAMRNAKSRSAYSTKNTKEAVRMSKLRSDMTTCKKNFGVAYMDLLMNDAGVTELEACVTKAVEDLTIMKTKLTECEEIIAYNKERLERKIAARRGELDPSSAQPPPSLPPQHEEGPMTTEPIHLVDHGRRDDEFEIPDKDISSVSSTPVKPSSSPASSPDTLQNTTMSTHYSNEESLPFDETTPDKNIEEESNRSNLSHPTPSAPFQSDVDGEGDDELDEVGLGGQAGVNEVEWARGVERPASPPLEPTIY